MTFYFDASIQKPVAVALNTVRGDVLWAGGPGAPARDISDIEWLEIAGRNGWAVIGRDRRIHHRPAEKRAVLTHGVRLFTLTAAGQYSKWGVLELLVKRWHAIEEIVENEPPPYIYAVTKNGIRNVR